MKPYLFSLLLLLLCPPAAFGIGNPASAPDTLRAAEPAGPTAESRKPLDRRMHRGYEGWERLIPTHLKAQYAGSMGLFSVGLGWDYGRKCRWETDVLVGYVPKYVSSRGHATLTLKQNYIPWSLHASDLFSFEPLYGGLYLNTIFGHEFWGRAPGRYPKGYYWFSTKLRIHIFWGCRATWHTGTRHNYWIKSVTFFFEANTCDLYIVQAIGNDYLRAADLIGFSVGVKLQIF